MNTFLSFWTCRSLCLACLSCSFFSSLSYKLNSCIDPPHPLPKAPQHEPRSPCCQFLFHWFCLVDRFTLTLTYCESCAWTFTDLWFACVRQAGFLLSNWVCVCVRTWVWENAFKRNELRDYRVMLIKSFIFYKGPNELFNAEFVLL